MSACERPAAPCSRRRLSLGRPLRLSPCRRLAVSSQLPSAPTSFADDERPDDGALREDRAERAARDGRERTARVAEGGSRQDNVRRAPMTRSHGRTGSTQRGGAGRPRGRRARDDGASHRAAQQLLPEDTSLEHLQGRVLGSMAEVHGDQDHMDHRRADQVRGGQDHMDHRRADQIHGDQDHMDHRHADHVHGDQDHMDHRRADQVHADQYHMDHRHADQVHEDQDNMDHRYADQVHADQDHMDHRHADQSRAVQGHADQSRADQSHADKSRADQDHTDQSRADKRHFDRSTVVTFDSRS